MIADILKFFWKCILLLVIPLWTVSTSCETPWKIFHWPLNISTDYYHDLQRLVLYCFKRQSDDDILNVPILRLHNTSLFVDISSADIYQIHTEPSIDCPSVASIPNRYIQQIAFSEDPFTGWALYGVKWFRSTLDQWPGLQRSFNCQYSLVRWP